MISRPLQPEGVSGFPQAFSRDSHRVFQGVSKGFPKGCPRGFKRLSTREKGCLWGSPSIVGRGSALQFRSGAASTASGALRAATGETARVQQTPRQAARLMCRAIRGQSAILCPSGSPCAERELLLRRSLTDAFLRGMPPRTTTGSARLANHPSSYSIDTHSQLQTVLVIGLPIYRL